MSEDEAKEIEENPDEDLEQSASSHALQLECSDNFRFHDMYKASLGKAFRVFCGPGCKDSPAFIFGAQIYHEISSICKAAV